MNKLTTAAIVVAAILLGAALFANGRSAPVQSGATNEGSNVALVDGNQIITIDAKGGYLPKRTTAKAGIPTILKMNTSGTFDCSSTVRIPSMGVSKNLPPSGSTEIDLGSPAAGPLQGVCVMGMYSFQIDFQ